MRRDGGPGSGAAPGPDPSAAEAAATAAALARSGPFDPVAALSRRVVVGGILVAMPIMGVTLVLRGADDVVVRFGYPPVMVGLLAFAWVLWSAPQHAHTATRVALISLDVLWLIGIAVKLTTAPDAATAWASMFPLSFMGVVIFVVLGFLDRSSRAAVGHGVGLTLAVVVLTGTGLLGLPGGTAYLVDLVRYGIYVLVVLMLLHVYSRWKDGLVAALAAAQQASATAVLMRDMAYADHLTGIANRRRLVEELTFQAGLAGPEQPLAVVYFDLDHFKTVNDTRGHAVGDEVLRVVARSAAQVLRQHDLVARLGGEEFVVVAPMTDHRRAVQLAERLRLALPEEVAVATGVRVTASFGVAVLRPGETAEELLRRVDGLMYEAKRAGRDRVSTSPD